MIGRQDYLNDDWRHARDWMLVALNKFDQGKQDFMYRILDWREGKLLT